MKLNAKSLRRIGINVSAVFYLVPILVVTCSFTMAQAGHDFIDTANGFKITLVGNWKAVPYMDAVGRQKTEFVNENREQGLLRITRDNLRGSSLQDVVRREIESFALCNSCVSTGQELFAGGSLSGIRVAHYYVEGNRRMAGEFYFLQDNEAVWALRFKGQAGSPGMAREIIDNMARSFCTVCPLYQSTTAPESATISRNRSWRNRSYVFPGG